jgi:hypothetical protein
MMTRHRLEKVLNDAHEPDSDRERTRKLPEVPVVHVHTKEVDPAPPHVPIKKMWFTIAATSVSAAAESTGNSV